jgi:ABC-type molybdate transport system permease subunit
VPLERNGRSTAIILTLFRRLGDFTQAELLATSYPDGTKTGRKIAIPT